MTHFEIRRLEEIAWDLEQGRLSRTTAAADLRRLIRSTRLVRYDVTSTNQEERP